MEITNNVFKVDRGGGYSFANPNREYNYLEITVSTPHGYARAYTQGDEETWPLTRIWFIHDGMKYTRSINNRYTRRGLITVARRFVREVMEQ